MTANFNLLVVVESVSLNSPSETLTVGDTVTLTATVLPSNAAHPEVTWTSSKEAVATVDANGKVTAVSVGNATITATADGQTGVCAVTVEPKRVTSVTLSSTSETLTIDDTVTLTATVVPSNAAHPEVTWTSSDEAIATVDTNGKVTAVSVGSVTITATAEGKSDVCAVMVEAVEAVASDQKITVTGTLQDQNGNTLAGVTVELHSTPMIAVTDAAGEFTFNNVEVTDHTLIIKNTSGTTLKEFAVEIETDNDFDWDEDSGTVHIAVQDNTVSTDITINVDEETGDVTIEDVENIVNPKTGDNGTNQRDFAWVAILLVLFVIALGAVLFKRYKWTA